MVKDLIGNEIKIGDTVLNVNTRRLGNVVAIYQRLDKETAVMVSSVYEVVTHIRDNWFVSEASRKVRHVPCNLIVMPEPAKKPMKAVV